MWGKDVEGRSEDIAEGIAIVAPFDPGRNLDEDDVGSIDRRQVVGPPDYVDSLRPVPRAQKGSFAICYCFDGCYGSSDPPIIGS